MVSATIEEAMLASTYIKNGKDNEMKMLAIIAGSVEGVGMETFSRVLVDYLKICASDKDNEILLKNIAYDVGVF